MIGNLNNRVGGRLALMLSLVVVLVVLSPMANAAATGCPGVQVMGCLPANPTDTVFFGAPVTGGPGTLVASLSTPFTSSLGTDSGTLITAVYREMGGTLDFYYQVIVNTTSTNCGHVGQPGCDPIARETDTSFAGWMTALGFRADCAAVGGPFISTGSNCSVAPVTGDRNSTGDVVGFSFNPPDGAKIPPGSGSTILVISTNATNFTLGNMSVIDGGVTTVLAYEPASGVPEPGSFALIGGGLLALAGIRRKMKTRRP